MDANFLLLVLNVNGLMGNMLFLVKFWIVLRIVSLKKLKILLLSKISLKTKCKYMNVANYESLLF